MHLNLSVITMLLSTKHSSPEAYNNTIKTAVNLLRCFCPVYMLFIIGKN